MKILITTDWYKPVINGVVTSVVNLAEGLEKLGHEVRILTLSRDIRSYRVGGVTYIGSVSAEKIYPNARIRTDMSGRYMDDLIQWCPDIVHSQCEFSTFVMARKISGACGCPLVHTYHTVYEDFTHYFSPNVFIGRHMAAAFSRVVLSRVQAVVAPTEKVRSMLRGYGVTTPIFTVPSGLELEQFAAPMAENDRDGMRRDLGLSRDDRVLIYLGRLAKEKNIEELLDLLLMQKDERLRLLLVGDGPYRSELEDAAAARGLDGRVIFAGMAAPDKTARYYRLGDVFVSASRSETQGLTYIEAMACGLPILCRDDPCLEQVVLGGVNGFTYRDPQEFGSILDRLFSDAAYRQTVGRAAARTVSLHFSSTGFAEKTAGVYARVLGGNMPVSRAVALCAAGRT